jgi:predicted tellurium resistance membrane protein TerC
MSMSNESLILVLLGIIGVLLTALASFVLNEIFVKIKSLEKAVLSLPCLSPKHCLEEGS